MIFLLKGTLNRCIYFVVCLFAILTYSCFVFSGRILGLVGTISSYILHLFLIVHFLFIVYLLLYPIWLQGLDCGSDCSCTWTLLLIVFGLFMRFASFYFTPPFFLNSNQGPFAYFRYIEQFIADLLCIYFILGRNCSHIPSHSYNRNMIAIWQ